MSAATGLPFDIVVLASLGVFVYGLLWEVSNQLRKRK